MRPQDKLRICPSNSANNWHTGIWIQTLWPRTHCMNHCITWFKELKTKGKKVNLLSLNDFQSMTGEQSNFMHCIFSQKSKDVDLVKNVN